MKTPNSIPALVATTVLLFCVGCDGRKDAAAPEAAKSGTGVTSQAVKQAGAALQEAATAGSAKAQALIDSAKGLVAQGKFQDALAKLKELGSEPLSAPQQSMVDALKAQIEKAIAASSKAATDVGSAAGGLIKK